MKASLRALIAQGIDALRSAGTLPADTATPDFVVERPKTREHGDFATNAAMLRNPAAVNFLDGCAISLPMHGPGEAPCGLMAMAPHGHDRALFGVAAAIAAQLSASNRSVTCAIALPVAVSTSLPS